MATPGLSEIVTTTLRDRASEIADNISQANALLTKIQERGNIQYKSGGREIVRPLSYPGNSSYTRIDGFDTYDITPYEDITSAYFDWKFAVTNVSLAKTELLKNAGRAQEIDLVSTKIDNAIDTLANNINADCYSDGTADGSKQITGLQALVADDPTTSTTVGGISQSTYSWWQNQVVDFSTDVGTAATSSNILTGMNTLYDETSRGKETTDLIMADTVYYPLFRAALQDQQRFTNEGDMAKKGFVSLKFLTADVVLENSTSSIPASHMYFLNTKYIFLDVHEDGMMQVDEERISINQLATSVPILFAGNMTVSNRARQGVLKA